ncbi:MAG: hypothetical protein PVG85_02650 [Deltaproteobacteria bacterium]|jgi:hypothetical protein
MLDVSVSYNRYKFLGYEYLTWLWFVVETDQDRITNLEQGPVSMEIGNRMVLEKKKKDARETITIKGDDAGLEEGMLALRKGALVAEINILLKANDQQWRFTVKAESLHFVGFKVPPTGPVKSEEDLEGAVLEKAYLYDMAMQWMDKLYKQFITLRVSEDWPNKVVPLVRQWMHS